MAASSSAGASSVGRSIDLPICSMQKRPVTIPHTAAAFKNDMSRFFHMRVPRPTTNGAMLMRASRSLIEAAVFSVPLNAATIWLLPEGRPHHVSESL